MGVCCSIGDSGRAPGALRCLNMLPGAPLLVKYKLKGTLKARENCTVTKAEDRESGQQIVLKSLWKTQMSNPRLTLMELNRAQDLAHANIVKILDVVEDADYIHVVSEYCNRRDLMSWVQSSGPLTEGLAALWLSAACNALIYSHQKNICNQNIRLEHLLMQETNGVTEYKLGDFGISQEFVNTEKNYYVAPEAFLGGYIKECDVWALGVSLYFSLTLMYPFYEMNSVDLINRIVGTEVAFHDNAWDRKSNEVKDLLKGMLTKNYKERISIYEVLLHPWLKATVTSNEKQHSSQGTQIKVFCG